MRDAQGPRCAWSASSASLKFKGTAASVKINEAGNDLLQVAVDGKSAMPLKVKSGVNTYALAAQLPDGEHSLEILKRTEASQGTLQILGFQFSAGGTVLDQAAIPTRRIEVIGDSISCGYGNEGKSQNEHFRPDTENAYLTYGAIAARTLKAEYVCIAWSGKKMWPNNTIPELYDRALPNDKTSTWDFSKQIPDVVLINLATNDFGAGNPEEKGWCDAYKKFIAHVRANYPHAAIYCASGSMMSDSWPPEKKALSTLHRYLTAIIEDEAKAGDSNVHLIEFEPQNGKNGLGSDWHPSVKTHELMAAKLVETLKKDLNWK